MKLTRIVAGISTGTLVALAVGAVLQGSTHPERGSAEEAAMTLRQARLKIDSSLSDDAKIATVTAHLLAQNGYTQQRLDSKIAGELFDRYLDELDPQRVYFLQSDIDEFAPQRATLDRAIWERGDTSIAQTIFKRLLQRADEQVAYVNDALKTQTFTFDADETFDVDRKKAARPKTSEEAQQLWLKQLRFYYLQEKLGKKKPEDIVKTLNHRFATLSKNLHEETSDDVFEAFLNTLTQVYDPHSDYFGKQSADQFNIQMRLSLFGIGARLQNKDGYTVIEELTPGGPAIKSGKLSAGDRIVAVAQDGKEPVDVVDMRIDKVVEQIRGPKGTTVRLTIIPKSATDLSIKKVISLVRDEIKLEDSAAKARLIEMPTTGNKFVRIGVINLPTFYQDRQHGKSATADVLRLLKKLKQEQVAGVILDLRNNPGGSLPEAISLTGLFIKGGPVVQVRDPAGKPIVDSANGSDFVYDGPLLVMTNKRSASASEIVAGALQDYGRAVVIGDSSTFGKGTVQAVIDLKEPMNLNNLSVSSSLDPGSLHLTIQKFYRPSGSSTQRKGVASDIVVPSITGALKEGEATLPNALPWDVIPSANYSKLNQVQPYLKELKRRAESREATDKDFIFLRQEIARFKKLDNETTVSLNEKKRLQERQENDARQKARQKALASRPAPKERVYQLTLNNVDKPGLPAPLPKTSKATVRDTSQDPVSPDDATDSTTTALPERDFTLDESERILLDYVNLSHMGNAVVLKQH